MVNHASNLSKSDGSKYLVGIFKSIQLSFLAELDLHTISQTHNSNLGEATEDSWMKLLKKYLPNRYGIDSAKVVDCNGTVSQQIDIVIYDPQYTPALYGENKQRYLPRESVYAVFEVKQNVDKENLIYAGGKIASVRNLKCTSADVVGNGVIHKGRKPFKVLGGLLATSAKWVDGLGTSFAKNLPESESDILDFVFAGNDGTYIKANDSNLQGDACLIQGLFQFLDILNDLGTVPAIDWKEYGKVFEE